MKNKRTNYRMILPPLILILIMNGGIYSYSVYVAGSLITILLIIILHKNNKTRCVKTELFAGCILIPAVSLISVFVAIDQGMAWTGFLRATVFAVWMYYLMQFTKEERDQALFCLPVLGAGMVIAGIIAFFIPKLKGVFWMAGRFGGTFQYSNTCALFCLICIMIAAEKEKMDKKQFLVFDILLAGLFLTGSKGGILLLIPVMMWVFRRKKEFRKNGIIALGILFAGGIGYGFISGDFQNIARIYTILKYPSTLFGRLLYMKDALPVMLKKPLGIGYMGYESIQPVIQTGVYTSRFVHNDWIQMALDFGWLFVIVLGWILFLQLKNGKQEFFKKAMLVLAAVYSLVEFHLQFFFIVMTVALCLDYNEDKVEVKKKGILRENQIFSFAGTVLFGYFAMASFYSMSGDYQMALEMFPYDTVALEGSLIRQTDKEKAEQMAVELLGQNAYNSQAYNILAYAALMDGEYQKALDYKLEVLSIERFNMNEYADFENMVTVIMEQASESEEVVELCELGIQRMNEILEKTKESVSSLAYKLRDKPEFNWD